MGRDLFYKVFSQHLNKLLNITISQIKPVSGGDINEAFKITTETSTYFVKANTASSSLSMFQTEAKGLTLLNQTAAVRCPNIVLTGTFEGHSYLMLEFINPFLAKNEGWENLGRSLAIIHKTSNQSFGLDHDNFIGTLPQSNNTYSDWASFFINQRLTPQLKFAESKEYINNKILRDFDLLFKMIPNICPTEPPSLIHGDFWNGNFIIDKDQNAVFIDPSVAYAHREMDIAMSYLFGGFDDRFYQAYNEHHPLQPGINKRVDIYQLYYLLVHVNLFGLSYLNSVKNILKRYV